MPPITSMTMSTSRGSTRAGASSVSRAAGRREIALRVGSRTPMPTSSSGAPMRAARSSAVRGAAARPGCRRPRSPAGRRPERLRAIALTRSCGPSWRVRPGCRWLQGSGRVEGEQVVERSRGAAARARTPRVTATTGGRGRGCSCWPSTGSRRRWRRPRAGRRARRSAGSQVSLTTMSPLSQCLPTTRHSTGLGASDGRGSPARTVYSASYSAVRMLSLIPPSTLT
jgi:hypothetical protein